LQICVWHGSKPNQPSLMQRNLLSCDFRVKRGERRCDVLRHECNFYLLIVETVLFEGIVI
jgi:hypothetical protein